MKKLLILSAVLVIGLAMFNSAKAYTRVSGYYRSGGIYVQPHYRSYNDGYFSNNWSTKGNYNPYTGRVGYRSYRYW